jgi:hypothetical protein
MNPLDQLADITLPKAVSMWPLAWGYLLALALSVVIIGFAIFAFMQYRKKRSAKRKALFALANLDTTDAYYTSKVQVIMKSLCSYYLPLSSSSQRHGQQWKSLILSVYKGNDVNKLTEVLDSLYQGLYFPKNKTEHDLSNQNQQIQSIIKEWINTSFPCKQQTNAQHAYKDLDAGRTSEVSNV